MANSVLRAVEEERSRMSLDSFDLGLVLVTGGKYDSSSSLSAMTSSNIAEFGGLVFFAVVEV